MDHIFKTFFCKTRSKRPRSHFLPKRSVFPYVYPAFYLLCNITISLFLFELQAEEQKNSISISISLWPFCRPAADSILMPPTFHIASLSRYTPKQGGISCGAIDEPRKSSKAIDKRVIINFRDKNAIIRRFRDKNDFYLL